MSIWISTYCRTPTIDLSLDDIRAHIEVLDLWSLASEQGLDQDVVGATRHHLRLEPRTSAHQGGRLVWLFVDDGDVPITIDFVDDPSHQRERLEEDASLPDAVRSHLARTTNSVNLCLKQSHADGMGWPIAFQVAMFVAGRADGVVDADGVWWDPRTYDEIR